MTATQLDGRSVVVTGAGAGVGRATALLFAREGARLVCADVDVASAEETVDLVAAAGGTARAQACDVSLEEDVEQAVAAAVAAYGRLDVVFNNAGIASPRSGMRFEEHSVEDFDRLVAVNLRGVFLGCRAAVRAFKSQGTGGVILNTGSVAGMVGWGGAVYGATKGAVIQLTRAVAVEAAPFDIRVNVLCPAAMPTTSFRAEPAGDRQAELLEVAARMHPLGRYITPEDCAAAALYLASDAARNLTGVVLPIDGGYVAR